jgi:hypothetical protein
MNNRSWPWLFVLGASLVSLPAPVLGQAPFQGEVDRSLIESSHRLDKLPPPARDLEGLFQLRLLGENAAELEKRIKELTPAQRELMEKMLKDNSWREQLKNLNLKDKQVPQSFRDLFKGLDPSNLESQLTQERANQLRSLLQRLPQDSTGPSATPPQPEQNGGPATEETMTGTLQRRKQALANSAPPHTPAAVEQHEDASPGASPTQPPQSAMATQSIMNFADRLRHWQPALARSPAFNKAVLELSRHVGEDDPRWGRLESGATTLQHKLQGFGESLHLERFWPKDGLSIPQGWLPKSSPGAQLPSAPSISAPTLPSLGGPGVGLGSWQNPLALLGLAGLAFLVWRVLAKYSGSRDLQPDQRRQLGPWPVQPSAVRSRDELIRAFEYLSLLSCGPHARTWNHRFIAGRLADGKRSAGHPLATSGAQPPGFPVDPGRREQAALELAGLYEKARYAPLSDPFPDSALLSARHNLCYLAGVPSA